MMNVYLRALEIEDARIINTWRNDHELTYNLAGNFFFVSYEREKESIRLKILDDSKHIYLGICENESKKLIGYGSINNIDLRNLKAEWRSIFIGDKEYLGKGFGKEASSLILRFLFDQYPINKCYGYCFEDHPATPSLLKTLGFKKEGVLRDHIYKNGVFKNVLLFSILRNEINGQF